MVPQDVKLLHYHMKNFHKDSSVARFRWSSDESDQDYLERNRVIGQCEDELSRILCSL